MFYVVVLDVKKKELFGFTVSDRTTYDTYTDNLVSEASEFYCELYDGNGYLIEGHSIIKKLNRLVLEGMYAFSLTSKSFHDFAIQMALIEAGLKQPKTKVH